MSESDPKQNFDQEQEPLLPTIKQTLRFFTMFYDRSSRTVKVMNRLTGKLDSEWSRDMVQKELEFHLGIGETQKLVEVLRLFDDMEKK